MNTIKDRISTLVFYLSILIFIIGFNFSDVPLSGGWYQQFIPNIGGRQITDIIFVDSLNGYAVTNNLSPGDTGYILKTTNKGDNWNFSFTINRGFTAIGFGNFDTGYACGGSGGGTTYLCRTINAGLNWSLVNSPSAAKWKGMSVLSYDTLWLVDDDGLTGGVYFTSTGGASWIRQVNLSGSNPDRIYMFNARFGFIAQSSGNSLYKTIDGGANWTLISNNEGFNDMFFVDSLTGWKAGPMKKTTNGGLNWVTQTMPGGGMIQINGISRFTNLNRDTIWGTGGYVLYPNSQVRSFLNRTTDGGNIWLFQIPDTSIVMGLYSYCDFINKLNGWAYTNSPSGIHTITGGNDTFFTSVKQITANVPEEFKLFQNYPNPFNPNTRIKYQITSNVKLVKPGGREKSNVILIVYDIQGKALETLVNEKQSAGTYEVIFDGSSYSSGVYFYSLYIDGELAGTKKMLMIK